MRVHLDTKSSSRPEELEGLEAQLEISAAALERARSTLVEATLFSNIHRTSWVLMAMASSRDLASLFAILWGLGVSVTSSSGLQC